MDFGLLNYRWVFSAGRFLQSAVANGTSNSQLGGPVIRTFQLPPPDVPNDASEPQQRKVELWARNCREFCRKWRLPRHFWVLLRSVNLRHETDGFTSPPKEGVLRIFSSQKSDGFGQVWTRELGYQRPARLPLDHRSRFIQIIHQTFPYISAIKMLITICMFSKSLSLNTYLTFDNLEYSVSFCKVRSTIRDSDCVHHQAVNCVEVSCIHLKLRNVLFSYREINVHFTSHQGGSCSCTTMPRLTGHLQPRRNWPTSLDYPPYSPDLAPSDYHLFPGLNKQLKGRRPLLPRRPGWTDNILIFFK